MECRAGRVFRGELVLMLSDFEIDLDYFFAGTLERADALETTFTRMINSGQSRLCEEQNSSKGDCESFKPTKFVDRG